MPEALRRLLDAVPHFPPDPEDRRPPLLFWLPVVLLPAFFWLFVLPIQASTGPPFLDWNIYRHGFDLWRSSGSPYELLPPGWDPYHTYPYLYPPTSWPLMVLAVLLPPTVVGYYLVLLLGHDGLIGGPIHRLTGASIMFSFWACVVAAAVWHYAGRGLRGWFWSLAVIAVVYFTLSILLDTRRKFAPRTYRFAE